MAIQTIAVLFQPNFLLLTSILPSLLQHLLFKCHPGSNFYSEILIFIKLVYIRPFPNFMNKGRLLAY